MAARDGLQDRPTVVATESKLGLIARSLAAGVRRLEVASFVNAGRVPQMADAEQVVETLPDDTGATFIGLVLNERGAARALRTKIGELGGVAVASDRFGIRNQGQTSEESLSIATSIVRTAVAAGRTGQVTIAAAFGCPFEGRVPIEHVVAMSRRIADAGAREVGLADTIGVAVPEEVSELVTLVREAVYPVAVRAHLHDSGGLGLANVWSAVEAGASTIDASLGGIGGCPFAPGAAGNVATEEVVQLLDRNEIDHGLDAELTAQTSRWLQDLLRQCERDHPLRHGMAEPEGR